MNCHMNRHINHHPRHTSSQEAEIEATEKAIRIEKSNVRIALNTLALLKTSEPMRALDWQVCASSLPPLYRMLVLSYGVHHCHDSYENTNTSDPTDMITHPLSFTSPRDPITTLRTGMAVFLGLGRLHTRT